MPTIENDPFPYLVKALIQHMPDQAEALMIQLRQEHRQLSAANQRLRDENARLNQAVKIRDAALSLPQEKVDRIKEINQQRVKTPPFWGQR